MSNDQSAKKILDDTKRLNESTKKYIEDLDKKIAILDKKYVEFLIKDETRTLKTAKKIIERKN